MPSKHELLHNLEGKINPKSKQESRNSEFAKRNSKEPFLSFLERSEAMCN